MMQWETHQNVVTDILDTLMGVDVCVCINASMQLSPVCLCLDIGNAKISKFLHDREKQMSVSSLGELPPQPSWREAFSFTKALQGVQNPEAKQDIPADNSGNGDSQL